MPGDPDIYAGTQVRPEADWMPRPGNEFTVEPSCRRLEHNITAKYLHPAVNKAGPQSTASVTTTGFCPLTVLTAAATLSIYEEAITDPTETVNRLDDTFAIVLGVRPSCWPPSASTSASTSSPTSSARRSTSATSRRSGSRGAPAA